MPLHIEPLVKKDGSDVVLLFDRLGWDYSEEEIDLILKSGSLFGHRNKKGKVISTAAIFPYKTIASLGMVMVDPDYRRIGLATQLVKKCISKVSDRSIMLVATEEGKPLYEKLGFQTVTTLHKFVAKEYISGSLSGTDSYTIRPILKQDIPEIIRLDQEAFGGDRSIFLENRIKQAVYRVMLRSRTGEVLGYGLGVQNPRMLMIGPVVAPDTMGPIY
nr:GNAT family N-acetyltransferase [Paludifilum halophilum]